VSAKNGTGVVDLMEYLAKYLYFVNYKVDASDSDSETENKYPDSRKNSAFSGGNRKMSKTSSK
jgi:hypothetical protein